MSKKQISTLKKMRKLQYMYNTSYMAIIKLIEADNLKRLQELVKDYPEKEPKEEITWNLQKL